MNTIEEELIDAITKGDVPTLDVLLSKKPILRRNGSENPFLFIAARQRKFEIFEKLVVAGADLQEELYDAPLSHYFLHWGSVWSNTENEKFVNMLEAKGMPIQRAYRAALLGSVEEIKMCTSKELNYTCLRIAIMHGHLNIVQLLIEKYKLSLEKRQDDLLHKAVEEGYLQIAQCLVYQGGADADREVDGDRPLHVAARHGHLQIVQWLVQVCDANIEMQSGDGASPIHYAIVWEHLDIARWLQQKGANINTRTAKYGSTPLQCVAASGKHDIVQWLCQEGGADIHLEGFDGTALRTALQRAVREKHWAVVNILISEHAKCVYEEKISKCLAKVDREQDYIQNCFTYLENWYRDNQSITILPLLERYLIFDISDLVLQYYSVNPENYEDYKDDKNCREVLKPLRFLESKIRDTKATAEKYIKPVLNYRSTMFSKHATALCHDFERSKFRNVTAFTNIIVAYIEKCQKTTGTYREFMMIEAELANILESMLDKSRFIHKKSVRTLFRGIVDKESREEKFHETELRSFELTRSMK